MTYHDKVRHPTVTRWGIALIGMLLILTMSCALSTPKTTPSPLAPPRAPAEDFQAGWEAYERGDYAAAVVWWRAAAEQGYAPAQEALPLEMWRCFDRSDSSTVLFTLYRLKEDAGGFVSVAGITHRAMFRVAGLERRWNFPSDADALLAGGAYPYAFLIDPNGTGLYVDFSTSEDGTATPRASYKCLLF